MHDQIVAYLRGHPEGVSSQDLAERFLRLKPTASSMALVAVRGILADDRRCVAGADGLWRAAPSPPRNDLLLQDLRWSAVHVLIDPGSRDHRALHVAVWNVGATAERVHSLWLVDPSTLSSDDRELLQSDLDEPYDPQTVSTACARIAATLESRVAVLLTTRHLLALLACGAKHGESFTDDTIVTSQLLRAAAIPVPRPLSLASCAAALAVGGAACTAAFKMGARFAECLSELLRVIALRGIETRGQLDSLDFEFIRPDFAGRDFTVDSVSSLPSAPGVYGFMNSNGVYIYIGKAKDLKRRILSYFRDSDESPPKLHRLRAEAHSLTTHLCGSELESLIIEYRLIKKYAPALNSKVEISERKGVFSPINDCIVLLPHAEPDKGMSFWFRRDQKILLKPFDRAFNQVKSMLSELSEFFFAEKLPARTTDFPEQEIAFRWIRRHQDSIVIVPVSRMESVEEIFGAMRSYWRDVAQSIPSAPRPPADPTVGSW